MPLGRGALCSFKYIIQRPQLCTEPGCPFPALGSLTQAGQLTSLSRGFHFLPSVCCACKCAGTGDLNSGHMLYPLNHLPSSLVPYHNLYLKSVIILRDVNAYAIQTTLGLSNFLNGQTLVTELLLL